MWLGVLFALIAGLLWGLGFVTPMLLPDYSASMQAVGRYVAFGLIALPMALLDRARLAQLSRADWLEALKLALAGNLLYYLFLASAIARSGSPLPTVIIGTLPVVIAVVANVRNSQRDGRLPWSRMVLPLLLMLAGIACVNQSELSALQQVQGSGAANAGSRYAWGALLALGALACWTWYPIRNADWLRNNPGRSPRTWATAQGIATLPLALCGYVLIVGCSMWVSPAVHTAGSAVADMAAPVVVTGRADAAVVAGTPDVAKSAAGATDVVRAMEPGTDPVVDAAGVVSAGQRDWCTLLLGARPAVFVGLMLIVGLLSSWLGTLCWNEASQRLPTSIAGQLIVFETLAALTYTFALRGQMPSWLVVLGIGLLVLGVLLGVRVRPEQQMPSPTV